MFTDKVRWSERIQFSYGDEKVEEMERKLTSSLFLMDLGSVILFSNDILYGPNVE